MLCPGPGRRLLLPPGLYSWVNHLLVSLVHAWAGWRYCCCCLGWPVDLPPPRPRGQCITLPPSQVPLGNAAFASFLPLYSVVCCRVWESSSGLQDRPWCLGMAGQGPPEASGGAGAIPVPQHKPLLLLGQGRVIQSRSRHIIIVVPSF